MKFNRSVNRLHHFDDLPAGPAVAEGTSSLGYALQEMGTLIFQWLTDLHLRAHDIAVAHLQLIFSIGGDFYRPYDFDTLVEDSYPFQRVEVIKDNTLIAADDDHLPNLVGVRPTHMDMADDFIMVSECDKPDVFAAVVVSSAPIVFDTYPFANIKGKMGLLVIHGDQDTSNPLAASQRLAEAAKMAGVSTEYATVPGGTHLEAYLTYAAPIFDFLDRHKK